MSAIDFAVSLVRRNRRRAIFGILLVAFVVTASGWIRIIFRTPQFGVAILAGSLRIAIPEQSAGRPMFEVYAARGMWFWLPVTERVLVGNSAVPVTYLEVTYVFIPLIYVLAPVYAWWYFAVCRTSRSHADGHCRYCGYSLYGIDSNRCPECGMRCPLKGVSGKVGPAD